MNPPRNLSERRFRGYWERTDSTNNERQRFSEVAKMIEENTRAARVDGKSLQVELELMVYAALAQYFVCQVS